MLRKRQEIQLEMAASMRGLNVFIADLRNCRVKELEEKRINKELSNIRSKFRDVNLNGYQKKKYVCKLIYIHILGWDIDFGHMEAVNLLAATKYTEKMIGYLAITLLLPDNSEYLKLVIDYMKRDLYDSNQVFNCLAIHSIANIAGLEMAEELSLDVYKILIAGSTNCFVKKKAALCLLQLYRKYPDVLPVSEWAPKIVTVMDDFDLGVALSTTTLVLAFAQNHPEACSEAVQKAIERLHNLVIENDFTPDYVYYKVPIPWLQVKLLKLLQYFPPLNDKFLQSRLQKVLEEILLTAQEIPKNVQHNNAQTAILFEAINLSIHLEIESIVAQATVILTRFITSKETNMRYLGLDAMTNLVRYSEALPTLKSHQEIIIGLLRDRDISVRRRALDLLYAICDHTNARQIVSELIQYLTISEIGIRSEMVLKIAILAEKYSTENSWYIDVILQLLSVSGEFVADEIWYRVVQIILEVEEVQEYAARSVFFMLCSIECQENAVKVGGYVLGEFGHLIAESNGCGPLEQFNAIHSKFKVCSAPTRAMLLTTYLKFVNLFPEIKHSVVKVFREYMHVLDVDLQQRAFEYYSIVMMENDDLLQKVCEEIPPFVNRTSVVQEKLRNETVSPVIRKLTVSGLKGEKGGGGNESNTLGKTRRESNVRRSLQLLHFNDDDEDGLMEHSREQAKIFHQRLLTSSNGVLYENSVLQIGVKTEYGNNFSGRLSIYYGNKSSSMITNIKTEILCGEEKSFEFKVLQNISSSVSGGNQVLQIVGVECIKSGIAYPVLKVEYEVVGGNGKMELELEMPVFMPKFIVGVNLSAGDFFGRWKQLGTGNEREKQLVVQSEGEAEGDEFREKAKEVIKKLNFEVMEKVDPKEENFVAAGIFCCREFGKVGILVRFEINSSQKMIRITLKSTNEGVTESLLEIIRKHLGSL